MKRFLLLLLAPALLAQAVDSYGTAAKGIRSDDPLRNAQAIEMIRRDRLVQLVPDLRRILAESASTKDAADVQMAVLDAMIDLGETMTPAEIAPFAELYPTFALILAARGQGDTTPLLLDLLSRAQRYEAYVATANLLLPRHSTEFARRVMSSMRTIVHVAVVDPCGDCSGGIGGGWSGATVSDATVEKPGWPAVGHYALTSRAQGHALAPGIESIYYQRTESREYRDRGFQGAGESSSRNRDQRNLEYAATMCGIAPAAFPIKEQEGMTVVWSDEESLISAVRSLEQRKRQEYASIVQTMVALGALSADDAAGLKLNIRLNVGDLRHNPRTPLPRIEGQAN